MKNLKMRQLRHSICTICSVFPIFASAGPDICQGLIQDKLVRPPQSIPKPAKRATYTDPAFGTTIRRITAVPAGAEDAVIKPMYATMQAWNADESLMILWQRGRGHLLFDGKNYNFIRQLHIAPTDIEQVLWDPVDPDLFYYPTNYNAVPNLMAHRLSTDTDFLVRNFQGAPTNCPVDWGKLLGLGSDPQYMSYDARKIIGLKCGDKKFTYSISQNQIPASGDSSSMNAPIPSPSGNFIYFDGYVLDAVGKYLRTLDMLEPASHASIGRSAFGNDSYNAVAFDDAVNGTLLSHNLNTGAKKVIIGPATVILILHRGRTFLPLPHKTQVGSRSPSSVIRELPACSIKSWSWPIQTPAKCVESGITEAGQAKGNGVTGLSLTTSSARPERECCSRATGATVNRWTPTWWSCPASSTTDSRPRSPAFSCTTS